MRLLLLGATGATGREVLRLALAAGHEVTAYVRDPDAVTPAPALTVTPGAVTDIKALTAALPGHDAVVATLGRVPGRDRTLQQDATRTVVQAANEVGVGRVVWMSALGVGESITALPAIGGLLLRTVLGGVFADKARGEAILRASGLDWTIAYPTTLSHAPGTGRYRATALGELGKIAGTGSISSADVALFLHDAATTGAYSRQIAALLPSPSPGARGKM